MFYFKPNLLDLDKFGLIANFCIKFIKYNKGYLQMEISLIVLTNYNRHNKILNIFSVIYFYHARVNATSKV